MIDFLIKARHAMSRSAAVLLLLTAVAISSSPREAKAADCYRNCYGCENCEPYQYLFFCCDLCQGQSPNCGCTLYAPGCG